MRFRPDPKPDKTPKKKPQFIKRKKPLWKNKVPFSQQLQKRDDTAPQRQKLTKILDHVFSKFIRQRGSDRNGYNKCFTCPKRDYWKNLQCGHFISRRNIATRWDDDNCRPQCPECNMINYGMREEFSKRLGQEMVILLDIKSHGTQKVSSPELLDMIKKYELKISQLR